MAAALWKTNWYFSFSRERLNRENFDAIKVNSVDGFQGQEKEVGILKTTFGKHFYFQVIILSTVRSNPQRNIGFLNEKRRLNVAVSNFKQILINRYHHLFSPIILNLYL